MKYIVYNRITKAFIMSTDSVVKALSMIEAIEIFEKRYNIYIPLQYRIKGKYL